MSDSEIRIATSDADKQACLRIRWTVFVEEQGVPPSLEVDEYDSKPTTVHLLASYRGVPAGAGRFVSLEDGLIKIGRLAVIDDVRGKGFGKLLLRALEEEARRRGARQATLGAQVHARAFYEGEGYSAIGDVFDDAGIPHIEMRKKL
jgi:predicted GNAT family N-acyltransferase